MSCLDCPCYNCSARAFSCLACDGCIIEALNIKKDCDKKTTLADKMNANEETVAGENTNV